jgi:hypothetical protein
LHLNEMAARGVVAVQFSASTFAFGFSIEISNQELRLMVSWPHSMAYLKEVSSS